MVRMTKVMIKTGITTVQALGRNPNKAASNDHRPGELLPTADSE